MINKHTKKCAICREPFVKRSSWQKVCNNPDCAQAYAEKERKKRERKELREKKEKLKSRADWLADAQKVFNQWIRFRDKGKPCISCGKPDNGDVRDAGHYRSVGAAPQLRYTETNVAAQCRKCNTFLSGNQIEYRIGLVKRIGLEQVEILENDCSPAKFTIDDAKAIIAEYRKRLKDAK